MALSYDDLVRLWGDRLVALPLDRLRDELRFDPALLPPGGVLPAEVPILFTAELPSGAEPFEVVEFRTADAPPARLVVLGATPDDPELRYALDTATGAVLLLDTAAPGLTPVNASAALFVEFLYRLARLLDEDRGAVRAVFAHVLRADLAAADPAAFADPRSWWSIAFDHLTRATR